VAPRSRGGLVNAWRSLMSLPTDEAGNDQAHVHAAKAYIPRHTRKGAWVWGG